MKFTSPLMTVLNQKLQSLPTITSPTIVALGAMKQLDPNDGNLFSTGSITGMEIELNIQNSKLKLGIIIELRPVF
jgi:hypothetical protein